LEESMDEEKRRKLEAELEEVQAAVREALEFIDDDRHLTDEGMAAREVLRRDLEEIKRDMEAVRQEHSADRISGLEEQSRRRAAEAEQEQLEREVSGNLTPHDEEMVDLREERLRQEAFENALKPGDRVRKSDGTTATVVTAPRYYERANGHPFTGWAVLIDPDEAPDVSLTRVEKLALIPDAE
jgi:hypothetical protein